MVITRKKVLRASLASLVLVGIVIAGIQMRPTQQVEASRVILLGSDLYSVGEAFGKPITTSKDIKMLFEERDGVLLVGRGIEGRRPESESFFTGTKLHLIRSDGTEVKRLSDDLIIDAFFDRSGLNVYYVTIEQKVWVVNLEDGTRKLVAEKVTSPSLSPDGTSMAYSKLNADWEPGEYYENALGLAVLNLETGEDVQITTQAEDFAPQWTPDGSHILFFSGNAGDSGGLASHFIVKADGSGRKLLTNINEVYVSDRTIDIPGEKPRWSSDGMSLVYESDNKIWVNTFENNYEKIKSAKKIGYGKNPKWLPDGTVSIVVTDAKKPEKALIKVDKEGNIVK